MMSSDHVDSEMANLKESDAIDDNECIDDIDDIDDNDNNGNECDEDNNECIDNDDENTPIKTIATTATTVTTASTSTKTDDQTESAEGVKDEYSEGNMYETSFTDATQNATFVLGENIKYHTLEPELSTVPSYGPAYTSSLTACREWSGDVPTKYAKLFASYPHNVVSSYATTKATTTTNSSGNSSGSNEGSNEDSVGDTQKSLPKGWTELENKSLSFCSFQKLPWLMPGMFVAPYAHFLDGCMDISYALSESFSRITFMKLFSLFPDGSYLNNPKLSYMKVRAFTLEPLDNDGYIGVDGERIRYAPLHFHIVRALINLLTYN